MLNIITGTKTCYHLLFANNLTVKNKKMKIKLIKKTTSCKDKIPEVKLLYFCIKERLSRDLETNAKGIDLAIVSRRSIKTPTAKVLTAATI